MQSQPKFKLVLNLDANEINKISKLTRKLKWSKHCTIVVNLFYYHLWFEVIIRMLSSHLDNKRTGKPGVLQYMGLQRVGHDWATEQWTAKIMKESTFSFFQCMCGFILKFISLIQLKIFLCICVTYGSSSSFPSNIKCHLLLYTNTHVHRVAFNFLTNVHFSIWVEN